MEDLADQAAKMNMTGRKLSTTTKVTKKKMTIDGKKVVKKITVKTTTDEQGNQNVETSEEIIEGE